MPFLNNVTFPILSANINASRLPELNSKLNKSSIFTLNGQKIGVIGYITTETVEISSPGPNLAFDNIITSVQAEVNKLTQQGVSIIIALGHAGLFIINTILIRTVY